MGLFEVKKFELGTRVVAEAMAANSRAQTIVGGGDSAAAVNEFGLSAKMTTSPPAAARRSNFSRARAARHQGARGFSMRRAFICGNWKMNKTPSEAATFLRDLRGAVSMVRDRVEMAVAPPFTALASAAKALEGSNLALAAQNCHHEISGAFTGEVSAPMLKDLGVQYVILGHSERRQLFGETDAGVNAKIAAVIKVGMLPSSVSARHWRSAKPAAHWRSSPRRSTVA